METSQSWIANIAILDEKLQREAWYNTFWAPFSGNVDISKDDNGNNLYRPSGNPIEILNDFITQGRDNMMIPFLKPLTGAPVYGDTVLKGTGEDQVMWWLRSYVNQIRKAVIQKSGSMSEQRQKLYKLYDEARPQLAEWFGKYSNQEISRAFYEGVSMNLTRTTADDGLGLYTRYHPNFYYNAGGTITKVATTEGETPTHTEITSAVGSADTKFLGAGLMSLRLKVMELKIPQIVTKEGFKFWAMLVHPASLNNLFGDTTTYTLAAQAAFAQSQEKYPLIRAASAFFAGFAIFEDIVAVRGWDNETGGFFGDDDADRIASMFAATTITNNACSIVFGNNAMGKAVAQPLKNTNEVDDHGNIVELGAGEITGYNRADFTAEANAGESSGLFQKNATRTNESASGIAVKNQSSLIYMTDES